MDKGKTIKVDFKNLPADLATLIGPGNVEEAAKFLRELSLVRTSDGQRVSDAVVYQGFKLWWIHYDDLMYKFALPYTQYRRLLECLCEYEHVHLSWPPFSELFEAYLKANEKKYTIEKEFGRSLPFGIWLQIALSIPFLIWMRLKSPKLMLWTSDLFDPPRDHDFRLRFVYEELYRRNIKFAEFVRSMESWRNVLSHAWTRKRPVVYSYAISRLSYHLGNFLTNKYRRQIEKMHPVEKGSGELFKFALSTIYLRGSAGDIWSIKAISSILRFLNIKAAIIPAAMSRNFYEVLSCHILGIGTTGILHGAASRNYNVYDFMSEFEGKPIGLDRYGVWSNWWKEYYLQHSKVYAENQLFISGPMRPISKDYLANGRDIRKNGPVKVLFVSEQLAIPSEVLPYLEKIVDDKNFEIYFTFRSYKDGFESWLKANRSDILKKVDKSRIIRTGIQDALSRCDVAIGTMSTGVLEAVLQLKPFIFFHTNKWGDYFDLGSFDSEPKIYASDPEELVASLKEVSEISDEKIIELRERFFGNPYTNGSEWVVSQALKDLS